MFIDVTMMLQNLPSHLNSSIVCWTNFNPFVSKHWEISTPGHVQHKYAVCMKKVDWQHFE